MRGSPGGWDGIRVGDAERAQRHPLRRGRLDQVGQRVDGRNAIRAGPRAEVEQTAEELMPTRIRVTLLICRDVATLKELKCRRPFQVRPWMRREDHRW
jgi:hypothetical protein